MVRVLLRGVLRLKCRGVCANAGVCHSGVSAF